VLRGGRPSARLIVLLIVLTAAGCRSGQSTPSVVEQVGSTAPGPGPAGGPAKVAPRWEPVAAFAGTGDQRTAGFEIGAGAIQWRVTVSCTGGAVRVGLDREPAALAELSHCPAKAFGFSIRTGPAALDVAATGTWEVVVDQQVDSPVVEPLLAGMSDATRLAHGDFYGIDQQGSGTVALYRLKKSDGRHVFTFDEGERRALVVKGAVTEKTTGYLYPAPAAGTTPLYRMSKDGTPYLTVDNGDVQSRAANGWVNEGVRGYVLV